MIFDIREIEGQMQAYELH